MFAPLHSAKLTTSVSAFLLLVLLTISLPLHPSPQITTSDANTIKQLTSLSTDSDSTYLVAASTSLKDMAGNFLTSIFSSNALKVSSYGADLSQPTVTSFTFDQENGNLIMTFSETVNVSSVRIDEIILQNSANAPSVMFPLSTTSRVDHGDSNIVTVSLSDADHNAIKRLTVCNSGQACFLTFSNTTILDMVNLPVVPRPSTNALPVNVYINDTTSPALVSFTKMDLVTGQVSLSFSETVDVSMFDPRAITLQTLFETPLQTYTLTGGQRVTTTDGTSIVLNLTTPDLVAVKNIPDLCSLRGNCYLRATSSLVQDMHGNAFQPISAGAPGQIVTTLIEDNVAPNLVLFDLDINTRTLVLSWSEPVRASSLNVSGVTLLNAASNATHSYTLTGGLTTSPNGLIINVSLTSADLSAIKATAIGNASATTFISLSEGVIVDMAFIPQLSRAVYSSNTEQVRSLSRDTVSPTIFSFHINMDRDELIITFSEPIRTSPFDLTRFSLKPNCSTSVKHTLTGGSLAGSPTSGVSSVVLKLIQADIVKLKEDTAFATSLDNSYLQVEARTILDIAGNWMMAVSCQSATQHTADGTRAELWSFSIDMELGWLNLTFNDVVIASTLDASAFSFQDAAVSTVGATYQVSSLTNTTVSPNGYTIDVLLDPLDLFSLKSVTGLATSVNTTFLTMRATAIDGPGDRDVLAITDGKSSSSCSLRC